MSVYLFTKLFYLLLLFLLMCSTLLCGHVCATADTLSPVSEKTVNLFNENEEIKGVGATQTTKQVKDYFSPFFLKTGDVFVALAGVDRTCETDKTNINILTKHFDTSKDNNWKETVISGSSSAGGWKTELLVRKGDQTGTKPSVAKGFIAVAKSEKEIYLLLVNCTNENGSKPIEASCKFKITVGTFDGNTIAWTDSKSSFDSNDNELKLQFEKNSPSDNPFFGTAFLTHDKKIVFVLQTKTNGNKKITALVRQQETKDKFEILPTSKSSDVCHPYIFPWNKSIIKLTPDCEKNGQTKIEESTDMGNKWEDIKEPISRLTNFLMDKQDFATVNVDDKKLIFFTQQIATVSNGDANKYLWISDGKRAAKVGKIKFNSENTAHLGLLYYKEQLFLLAQNCKQDATKKVCLTRLDEHMTKIKSVLNMWKPKANNIQIPCTDVAQLAGSCSTDGLVDFLSVTTQGDTTQLESNFLNVDATIHGNGEVKIDNGVTFSGAGAGAVWPIGEQNNDQPYNFITSGFTLVATVKIENNDKEGNSLLGAVLGGEPKRVEMWCSSDKKWAVKTEKDALLKKSQKECEQGTTYTIALVLRVNKLLVYINWEEQTNLNVETIESSESQHIEHFYFGAKRGETTANTGVTISNILLYNKPFTTPEIEALKPKQNKIDTERKLENTDTKMQNPKKGTTQTDDSSSDTSTIENEGKEEAQLSSPPPTTEDGAVRVGVVGVLSLFFGVFTLLGRYVY